MYHVKHDIRQLYDLPPDNPTAMARRLDYLLERDRFICPHHGDGVGSSHWTWADKTNCGTNVGVNLQVPCPPDCGCYIRQVFRRNQNARYAGPSVSETHQWYTGLSDMCNTVPFTTALQTAVYKKPPNFNPEVVGGVRPGIIACFVDNRVY